MVPSTPQVVIVGGGFAGVVAARALRRTKAIVSVIDKRNHHFGGPDSYSVFNRFPQEDGRFHRMDLDLLYGRPRCSPHYG